MTAPIVYLVADGDTCITGKATCDGVISLHAFLDTIGETVVVAGSPFAVNVPPLHQGQFLEVEQMGVEQKITEPVAMVIVRLVVKPKRPEVVE